MPLGGAICSQIGLLNIIVMTDFFLKRKINILDEARKEYSYYNLSSGVSLTLITEDRKTEPNRTKPVTIVMS